jgi:hypothetical protein
MCISQHDLNALEEHFTFHDKDAERSWHFFVTFGCSTLIKRYYSRNSIAGMFSTILNVEFMNLQLS